MMSDVLFTCNVKKPSSLSWYNAPSSPNEFVLEYFPVGSSKSKFLDTPIELLLIAELLIIEL